MFVASMDEIVFLALVGVIIFLMIVCGLIDVVVSIMEYIDYRKKHKK